jgi:hypothetical protein
MSKANEKAMAMFQNASQSSNFKESYEVQEASNVRSFREEFITAPLTREEDNAIQLLLIDESSANVAVVNDKISNDHKSLVDITTQIRAIERQNVLLHGERIKKAQEILKPYKDGAFTRWLMVAYGNRQTPYRILQYYEFFNSLTSEVKQLMQSMPKKAAYVLAARDGDSDKKIGIIKDHYSDTPENIINIVQEAFPLDPKDGRKKKASDAVLVESIRSDLKKLAKRKQELANNTISDLIELRGIIDQIISPN